MAQSELPLLMEGEFAFGNGKKSRGPQEYFKDPSDHLLEGGTLSEMCRWMVLRFTPEQPLLTEKRYLF